MDRTFFRSPDLCPSCGGIVKDEGSLLYCYNKSCPSKATGSIKVWISKLGLLHWGDSLIESLTSGQNPLVNSVSDLYDLTVVDIAKHSSGIKFAQKCYDVLHSQKSIKIELVLSSLNIPGCGVSTATDIVHFGYDSIDKILALTPEDLILVPNIGEKTAISIWEGIHDRKDLLISLCTKLTINSGSNGVLSGKSFCITGATSTPRKALQKLILDNGGQVKESVVSGLSYLISNEASSSSKSIKAEKFGVTKITESDLNVLISGGA